jgi:AmmeMemoRadiSam system protein B
MSIVFSAITPHPPLLIPTIGKENLARLRATENSFKKLEEDLYSSKAETIFIISPHGSFLPNSFSINLSPEYYANFEEFGDFATKQKYSGNIGLAHKIRESMETTVPLCLVSSSEIDHGISVPLFLLTAHLPKIKIIPAYYSGLNLTAHFQFGQNLKKELMASKERIAVIASGDLSHKLNKNSPAGYSPKASRFDKKIIKHLTEKKVKEILKFKDDYLEEVSECGLRSIVILLGIMEGVNCEPRILSYEAPFGVGYLTMNYRL